MKRFRDTKYLVTEDGRVFSEKTNRFLIGVNNNGYIQINIGGSRREYLHRMIAECYIPNPNSYLVINHIDNNRSNNRVENLEWCTQKMNNDHMVNQDRNIKGSRNPQSKVTENDVIEIRHLYANKEMTQTMLAKKYNVCQSLISLIVTNKNWRHI